MMLVFGVVGYFFKKRNYPLAPLVLALVLGDKAEEAFRQSMLISQGSLGIFFVERPGRHDHGAGPGRPVLAAAVEPLWPAADPRPAQVRAQALWRGRHSATASIRKSSRHPCLKALADFMCAPLIQPQPGSR